MKKNNASKTNGAEKFVKENIVDNKNGSENSVSVKFAFGKETKNFLRYEAQGDGDIVGTLYVPTAEYEKAPRHIIATIETSGKGKNGCDTFAFEKETKRYLRYASSGNGDAVGTLYLLTEACPKAPKSISVTISVRK